jgi:anaphase-promoting complex subunit 8
MFQVKTLSELHQPTENELALCDRLLSLDFFPNSVWLMSLRACVLYHLHGHFAAYLFLSSLLRNLL